MPTKFVKLFLKTTPVNYATAHAQARVTDLVTKLSAVGIRSHVTGCTDNPTHFVEVNVEVTNSEEHAHVEAVFKEKKFSLKKL